MDIRISVRNLVEFILRSGDIDNRRSSMSPENAMAEGSRIHRMIQKQMGLEYQAEVSLLHRYDAGNYGIIVEGRADGIVDEPGELPMIDEIKGTYRELRKIKEPMPLHVEQAKCYAFMYAVINGCQRMKVQMTYCNIDTEELKYFHYEYDFDKLQKWYMDMLGEYRKWTDFANEWNEKKVNSIKKLSFPFPYREGQKELVTQVYQTIYHKKKIFIEAPTGVGKTISTVFPTIKSMGEGRVDKLFYLTAKTITRTVADDTISMLRDGGLSFKSVILTAKEKICFCEETECNPVNCPYAKGHYDRVNDAVFDLLTHEDRFNREKIEEYAKKHQVCPFEMSLDVSLFCDGIICDYNYLFDPHVYLKRFFSEGITNNYTFLIDEAHNLVERGRDMYSATLVKEDFLALKKVVKTVDPKMERQLEGCNKQLLLYKRACETYRIEELIDPFVNSVQRLGTTMEKFLEDHDESDSNIDRDVRKQILDFYFEVSHFLMIYEKMDDKYVAYSQMMDNGAFAMKLFCVDPSGNLKECMDKGRSSVLFSATLLPIQYYKNLLGGTIEDYEVYAKSVFNQEKKALFISSDVTSKYTRRNEEEYTKIARYIYEIVNERYGNYMIFFSSYAFMRTVHAIYEREFLNKELEECILQSESMDEIAREEYINRFSKEEKRDERNLLGFCIMGGIFGEGIDLKNDSLIGAIIVGTGLPQVCHEREILKNFFDEAGDNGFDYAYRYPGMNKVLQAAGRVIRTAEDVGVVTLLDERFLTNSYQKMFPREWEHFEVVNVDGVGSRAERFWDEWL